MIQEEEEDIVDMDRERFLSHELKWHKETEFTTKWSADRNILWVTFDNETIVTELFRRQARLERK